MLEIKQGNKMFYIGDNEKDSIGTITFYEDIDNGCLVVDHTYVDPQYRGQKLAKKLVDKMVDYARSIDKKVIPVCSYVAATFERNEELYEDVWEKNHDYNVGCKI